MTYEPSVRRRTPPREPDSPELAGQLREAPPVGPPALAPVPPPSAEGREWLLASPTRMMSMLKTMEMMGEICGKRGRTRGGNAKDGWSTAAGGGTRACEHQRSFGGKAHARHQKVVRRVPIVAEFDEEFSGKK